MKLSRHFVALVAAIVVQIAATRALPAPREDSLRTNQDATMHAIRYNAPGNEKRHGWIYPVADDGSDAIEPGVGDIKDEVSEALEKRLNIYPNTYHSTDEVNDDVA